MKIERLSDNQIRCTLTGNDLAEHNISIKDISYGTDRTRALFREMMERANDQLGFDPEDMPLMIEAVPLNADSIVFVITKVDDPEELDTRFSKFAPGVRQELSDEDDPEDGEYEEEPAKPAVKADELLSLFHQRINRLQKADTPEKLAREIPNLNISRIFAFSDFRTLMRAAVQLQDSFQGSSKLYKSLDHSRYLLKLTKDGTPIDQFNRLCNLVSEYGKSLETNPAGEAYLTEHCRELIPANAVGHLAELS